MTFPNARDCEHGNQRGKCVYCDLAEVEELSKTLHIKIEAQQVRIAELKKELRSLNTTAASLDMNYAETCQYFSVEDTLSRTDDLSALAAHDAEIRKATLLEAANHFTGYWNDAGDVIRELRRMAEGEK